MSYEERISLYEAAEFSAQKCKLSPSLVFLTLKKLMEKEQDPFTSEETIRVHKAPEAVCTSCEG